MVLKKLVFDDMRGSDDDNEQSHGEHDEFNVTEPTDNEEDNERGDGVTQHTETQAERMSGLLVPQVDLDDCIGMDYEIEDVAEISNLLDNEARLHRRKESKIDWPDEKMKGFPGLKLIRISQASKITIGKQVINDLHTGISQRTIGYIFLVAWNLKKSLSNPVRVYDEEDQTATAEDVNYKTLLKTPEPQVQINNNVTYIGSDRAVAEGLSFFCGTLFRLFAKTADNYLAAWESIKRTFFNFYGTTFPIDNFHPTKDMLVRLRNIFTSDLTYKNTLTGFIYSNYYPGERYAGIRSFMHELHLSFTGMHCVPLFIKALDSLGTSRLRLLSALYYKSTKRAIIELTKVLIKYEEDDEEGQYEKETWRFARIFSSEYFIDIQSQHCPELLVVLSGIISKIEEQDSRGNNVYKIAHIRKMSRDSKKIYNEVGVRIYGYFMGQTEGINNAIYTYVMGRKRRRDAEESGQESEDEDADEEHDENYEFHPSEIPILT